PLRASLPGPGASGRRQDRSPDRLVPPCALRPPPAREGGLRAMSCQNPGERGHRRGEPAREGRLRELPRGKLHAVRRNEVRALSRVSREPDAGGRPDAGPHASASRTARLRGAAVDLRTTAVEPLEAFSSDRRRTESRRRATLAFSRLYGSPPHD